MINWWKRNATTVLLTMITILLGCLCWMQTLNYGATLELQQAYNDSIVLKFECSDLLDLKPE